MKKTIAGLWMCLAAAAAVAQQPDISGVWQGNLPVDANTRLTIQFEFTKKPDGSYAALVNSPDNPAIKNVPASAVSYSAGALKLQVQALSGSYAAALKDGKFDGQWTQPGGTLPLVLSAYRRPQLSKAAISTLSGSWYGPIDTPAGKLTLLLRFKPDAQGELTGTVAMAEGGGQQTPVSDLEFTDNQLSLKVPMARAQITASYANGVLTGLFKQPGPGSPPEGRPITLKRGEFAAPVHALQLSTEAFTALRGKWQGQLTLPNAPQAVTVILRFEVNVGGQIVGFLDSPDQKANGLPLADATLTAGKLVVKLDIPKAEFVGTLSGRTLSGQWLQGPQALPLTLTRQ